MVALGPGTLTFGDVGAEIDASCLVNNVRIDMSKDQADATYKLCGDATPGKITYSFTLTGNLDTDVDDPAGLFKFSQDNAGMQVPFIFTPNTVAGTSAAGTVVMDPLSFGADEYGNALDSDFEFAVVGKPTYTYPVAAA